MHRLIDFEIIFEHAPVGMCVSQNRTILACNDAFSKIFGYSKEQLIAQSFCMIYPTVAEFERTGVRITPILNSQVCYSDERIMKRANQELFWCHVAGRGMQAANPEQTTTSKLDADTSTDAHAFGIWTFEDLSSKRPVSASLTPREREISALLVDGKTSKLIAREMGLSPRTVEMHRAKLMRKFNAATSGELVNKLLRLNQS